MTPADPSEHAPEVAEPNGPGDAAATGGTGTTSLLLAAGLAGAGTMVVELAAVRLLAPWFGTSQAVWTSVIGVVLLALALGYAKGARVVGERGPSAALQRALQRGLLTAAVWVALLPHLASLVAGLLVPRVTALDEAPGLALWGSLAAALVLFLPPAALLGMVSPLVAELLARRTGEPAGAVGGRVLTWSTLGSLLGVFGTTHVLIAEFGLPWTFGIAAVLLGTSGVLLGARLGGAVAGLLAAAGVGLLSPAGRPLPDGSRLLAEVQSPYQGLRVLERGEGPDRMRWLAVNEASDSFQSVWTPRPGLLGGGHYYDGFALPAAWDLAEGSREGWSLLVLGLGAGTSVRVLEGCLEGRAVLDWAGVELDPAVIELGVGWFDLEEAGGRVTRGDARLALRGHPQGTFDQVVVDCYANNMEVPPHLATLEFFREVALRLTPGGWISVNAGGFGVEDPVVRALGGTLAAAVGDRVLALEVPFSRNVALIARLDHPLPAPGGDAWTQVAAFAEPLIRSWAAPGTWAWFEAAGAPLSDAHAPLEALQRESISAGRRRWGTSP